jgi:hypothetical protein
MNDERLAELSMLMSDVRGVGGDFREDIRSALRELLALREQTRWIPVTPETMPPKGLPVLVEHDFNAKGVLGRDCNGQHVWVAEWDGKRWVRSEIMGYGEPVNANIYGWRRFPTPSLPPAPVPSVQEVENGPKEKA